jgi:hypothetical protein
MLFYFCIETEQEVGPQTGHAVLNGMELRTSDYRDEALCW